MLDDLKKELERTNARHFVRQLSPARPIAGAIIEVRGKQVVDFGNWDLLGVGLQPKVKRAAQSAIERGSVGVGAARLGSGTRVEHLALEQRLARFLGAEAALIFPSKNQGIFTIFSALLNERDAVLVDEMAQGPVSDAAFLVNASVYNLQPSNTESLAVAFEKSRGSRRRILFIEGVCAATGASPDLVLLASRCAKEDIHLIVDESFSLGHVGLRGAGSVESCKLLPPFAVIGDFGHSFGLFGGFVAGPQVLISYLIERSRALGLDVALPASIVCGIEAAIDFVELGHLAREELTKRAKVMSEALRVAHVPVLSPLASPVIAIRCPKPSQAHELAAALFQRGFFVDVLPSQVPFVEAASIRLLVSLRHTERQLEAAAGALGELVPRVLRK